MLRLAQYVMIETLSHRRGRKMRTRRIPMPNFGSKILRKDHAPMKTAQKVADGTVWGELLGVIRLASMSDF